MSTGNHGKSLLDDALDFGPPEETTATASNLKPSDLARLKKIVDQIQEISDRIDRLASEM